MAEGETRARGLRAVMDDVGEERREEELTRGQPFDDAHGRATARDTATSACGVDGRRGDGWRRRDGQDRATRREMRRCDSASASRPK